jgi:hypothetical protein
VLGVLEGAIPGEGAMITKKTARDAALEKAAAECVKVYREHRRNRSYPLDMGGLALECAQRILALKEKKP